MRRGVIVEIDNYVLTMLTPDGEFLQAEKQDTLYELGQEIEFLPIKRKKSLWAFSRLPSIRLKTPAIVAIVCMLLLATFSVFNKEDQVYAYMSIDINPSIEAGVDKNLRVIDLKPYNKEAEIILNHLVQWKDEHVHDVVKDIIAESNRQGFLKENQQVVIASVHHGKRKKKIDNLLAEDLKKLQTETNKEISVTIVEGTEQDRKHAMKSGMSTGKYLQTKEKFKVMEENKVDHPQPKQQKQLPPGQMKKPEPHMQEDHRQNSSNKGSRDQGESIRSNKQSKQERPDKQNVAPGQQKKAVEKHEHSQNNGNKMNRPESNLGEGKLSENKQKKNQNNNQNNNRKEDNRNKNSNKNASEDNRKDDSNKDSAKNQSKE